jgi:hypothetical protein
MKQLLHILLGLVICIVYTFLALYITKFEILTTAIMSGFVVIIWFELDRQIRLR